MKGFTLIETLIYMTLSTLLYISLLSMAWTLYSAQTSTTLHLENDLAALYWLRAFDTAVHQHEKDAFYHDIQEQAFIQNIASSSTAFTSSLSFTIEKQSYSLTVYEK